MEGRPYSPRGIAEYVRSDLPCDRMRKLEFNIIESINIEILVLKKKWLISGVYRPQTIDENTFNENFIKTCDQITTAYDNFMFISELNYDMLVSDKSTPLQNVCDIFDLTNLVKSPTCYTKNLNPSLNQYAKHCMNATKFNCGISDVHNLIAVQIKGSIIRIRVVSPRKVSRFAPLNRYYYNL